MGRSDVSTVFSQAIRRRDFLVRYGLAGLGVGLGGTVLSACGDDQPQVSGQPKDTLTIGMNYVISNFEPKGTAALSDFIYLRFIYDTLVSVDSGSPEPWLAESWEAVGDATHWRFKLRQGVTFSNGEPFNAEAVRFTFQRALDDAETHWLARIQPLETMEIIDDSTIDFHLSAPVGNWPTITSIVWIVPPKYASTANVLVTKPIGTGPFTLDSFSAGQTVTLASKPDYWGKVPKTPKVVLNSVPEESTRVSSLLAGDTDVAYRILPDFIEQVEAAGKKVVSVPSGQSANVTFQTTRGGPIADVRMRQAIDFALDKEAINKAVGLGYGRPLNGQLVGPNSVGYDPNLKARPYDPDKAKQLLKDVGYDGEPIGFDYPIGRYYRDKETCEAVTGSLQQVGINIKPNPMEGGTWLSKLYTGVWGPITYWSLQDAPAFDLSWTLAIYRHTDREKLVSDLDLDSMLDHSLTITDTKERSTYLATVGDYIQEQAYVVALEQDPGLYAIAPEVKDIKFLTSTYLDLNDATVTG